MRPGKIALPTEPLRRIRATGRLPYIFQGTLHLGVRVAT